MSELNNHHARIHPRRFGVLLPSVDNGWVRVIGVTCLVVVFAGVLHGGDRRFSTRSEPQRPLPAQGQAQLDALAREAADAVAASARMWVGNMHPAGELAFRKWTLVVESWRKEKASGPAARLAEGVLFDCLGRTLFLHTGFTSGRAVDRRFQDLGAANRFERATNLFTAAFRADPTLIEARFRAARIRATDDPTAALELESIATSQSNAEVSYLAAVSRAAIAHGKKDRRRAIHWYEHALRLHGRSTAAAVGLSALEPNKPLQFESLDPNDPYYDYPCRILTPSVAAEFTRRMKSQPPE